MYLCPNCKEAMNPPHCPKCGYAVKTINHIWQFTDMPDFVIDGDGDKYIGYEHIGENYSGNQKYIVNERDRLISEEIAKLMRDGVFLDLACGDGCLTVPCAALGVKVIAGDISNAMLGILQERASHNSVSLEKVSLCRMNALDIPLTDESVNVAVANSMLHLISNPQKVIAEIYRVLKKGGIFVCVEDSPGKSRENDFDNSKYNVIVSTLYRAYWNELNKQGIFAKKYSWHFDRDAYCTELFSSVETIVIKRGNTYSIPMKEGFLPRFVGRGFSDQVDVPSEIHKKIVDDLLRRFAEAYGDDFADVSYQGIEDDLVITKYRK